LLTMTRKTGLSGYSGKKKKGLHGEN
jgi:hypothetical protein